MKLFRWLLVLAFAVPAMAQIRAAYTSPSAGTWSPWSSAAAWGALGATPNPVYLYCQASAGAAWTPCNPSGGGSPFFSLLSYGAVCNGNAANKAVDTAALVSAMTAAKSGGIVSVPVGGCVIDNTSAISTTNFSGTIEGAGPGASLEFTTLANDGLDFTTPSGLTIQDLAMSFIPATTTRQSSTGYPFNINGGSNVYLSNLTLSNGNISALRVGNATHVRIQGITLSGFLANGVYTLNSNDEQIANVSCQNGGDACIEYDWLDSSAVNSYQNTITGVNSYNDVSCILLDGTSHVAVSNFNCYDNAHQAILVEQDSTTGDTTQYPDEITFANGNIVDAGYGTNPLNVSTALGIYIYISGSPATKQRLKFSNIHVVHSGGNGLLLADNNTVDLSLNNVLFDSNGGNGATGSNGRSQAAMNLDGYRVELNSVTVNSAAGPSLYSNLTSFLFSQGFTSINPNSTANTTNAIYYASGNGANTMLLNGVSLVDTQATNASGITNAATSGPQAIPNIAYSFLHAWPGVSNSNSAAPIYQSTAHLARIGSTPSAGTPVTTYAGTGATASVASNGTDNQFQITLNTGTGTLSPGSGSGGSVLVQITYSSAFATAPVCSISPANTAAALVITDILPGGSNGQFNLAVGGTALTASTTYKFNATCL